MPMVRTILPPIEFCWWPNTCSTRARTLERVVFADFWRSDSGRFRAARLWIRLCLLLALLAGIGARDFKGWRGQALTPAGGLPIAPWALAVIGMLWADAPPAERIDGMSSLTRLLAIPILLAHFRRSDRGLWVLIGFVASSAILLVLSWGLALIPDFPWRGRDRGMGIPVKDHIAQAQVFTLCVFGLCEGAVLTWQGTPAAYRRAHAAGARVPGQRLVRRAQPDRPGDDTDPAHASVSCGSAGRAPPAC